MYCLHFCPSKENLVLGIYEEATLQGLGADLTRAYLSNVCVAKELQRNGLGYALIGESKTVAHSWGDCLYYVYIFSYKYLIFIAPF